MDYQSQDPGQRPSPSGARVEDDFIQPLKPMRGVSHRRLPAALPLAIAGVLMVSTIAFGATLARNSVSPTAKATATINVVGDDPEDSPIATTVPTDAPTIAPQAPTDEPTATPTPTPKPTPKPTKTPSPTRNPSDLGALKVKKNADGSYTFSWSAYKGGKHYDYYKLDGQPYPNKPGYVENGSHYLSCLDPGTTSTTITLDDGTWNLNVEAVDTSGEAVAVARTSVLKLVVSKPTAPKIVGLSLTATAQADGTVDLKWSKYTGDYFNYYAVVRATGTGTPTLKPGQNPDVYFDSVSKTSWTDDGSSGLGALESGKTYTYRVYAYSERTFGAVTPACTVGTILAVSDPKTVTIP